MIEGCGEDRKFWFYSGDIKYSEDQWIEANNTMKKNACTDDLDKALKNTDKYGRQYTPKTPKKYSSPDPCGKPYWLCEGVKYDDYDTYKEQSACAKRSKPEDKEPSKEIKKKLGDKKYKELISIAKSSKENKDQFNFINPENEIRKDNPKKKIYHSDISDEPEEENVPPMDSFIEIAPLDCKIDNETQKDLSSIPISETDFPKIVFMIVDKKIELETKYLKDYAEWQFLSKEELNRKTIQIFEDFISFASGKKTKSEILNLGRHEFAPWQIGITG